MTRECPSCGNMVESGQAYCPMCGSKLPLTNTISKNENKYLKDEIAKAEAYATAVLYTKSKIVFNEVNSAELNFLKIIEKFPSEPQAYIAYVNYIIKYLDRALTPKEGDDVVFFNDLQGLIEKCKLFLEKALRYANEDIDGNLLQEICVLQSRLETFKLDDSFSNKNEENKKRAKKGSIIGGIVLFAIVAYLIYQLIRLFSL